MKKQIVITILILLIIVTIGLVYYFKIYMSDTNILDRYLESKQYSCIQNNCTKKEKDDKYKFDTKTKTLYVSNSKYILTIGEEAPVLKLKQGNEICKYEIDNYKRGDTIDWDITHDKNCKEYIEEINKYIENYNKILKDNKM